jgi:PhzF family phenazine biosynthesis protein
VVLESIFRVIARDINWQPAIIVAHITPVTVSDEFKMLTARKYVVVDAFTSVPTKGNPVAVILDAENLSDADMQAIACWTNLSETTFVQPATGPGADYLLRIFTPTTELPFAGHPTLGSAHAIIAAGYAKPKDGVVVQQCGRGLVRVTVEESETERRLFLELPAATTKQLSEAEVAEMEDIIGQTVARTPWPTALDVGPIWVVAQLASAQALLDLQPNYTRMAAFTNKIKVGGLSLYGDHTSGDAQIEVRSFVPADNVNEDPVCGSGNGCVGVYRYMNGLAPAGSSYLAQQGRKLGRDGQVFVRVGEKGEISLGGSCVTVVSGELRY